jgi:hypothetical protein
MNLRNAFLTLVVYSFSLMLAAGQQSPAGLNPPVVLESTISAPPVQNEERPASTKIFFTGHLLGYYRLPQWQSDDFEKDVIDPLHPENNHKSCPSAEPNTPADEFIKQLGAKNKGDVLVGMGDNFGVTLESRAWRERDSESKAWQIHTKKRDVDDSWGKGKPPTAIGDNVGCFLSRAGYDAIVPGKDDFYFGPERLLRIAARLGSVPKEAESLGMYPVPMLAANLVLKTDYWKKPPEILDSDKDLQFIPGMPTGVKSVDAVDNGLLLPFTKQIRFRVSTNSVYLASSMSPYLCRLKNGMNPDDIPVDCRTADRNSSQPEDSRPSYLPLKYQRQETEDTTVADFELPENWLPEILENEAARKRPEVYGLCIDPNSNDKDHPKDEATVSQKKSAGKPYCLRLTLAEPLFRAFEKRKDGKGKLVEKPPYVVKTIRNQDTYAVIVGVVDPDLLALVGRDNLSWRNVASRSNKASKAGNEEYKTWVDATDPATTIALALEHFDLVCREKIPQGAKIFKVLLAQMERGKAESLAAKLRDSSPPMNFDVVISSATDFSAATANETVTLNRPPQPKRPETGRKRPETDAKRPPFRQFVAVPWLGYDTKNHRLINPVRTLTLEDSSCATGICEQRTVGVGGDYENDFGYDESVARKDLEANYDGMGLTFLKGKGYWIDQAKVSATARKTLDKAFEMAALAVMRDHTHADVAILQKRAFYWGPFPQPLNGLSSSQPNGELLERILWMGDYERILTVKGSTLKKVLDISDKLDKLDEQATLDLVEPGRGLLTLGIEKTRDNDYLVDGTQLDPDRLYTVVTSNHISAGDNGYPDLADPQFAETALPKPMGKQGEAQDPHIATVVCEGLGGSSCPQDPGLAFASIKRVPTLPWPTLGTRIEAWGRTFVRKPILLEDSKSLLDYQAQLKPTWRFSLKDLSLNLSAVRNNLSEVQRSTELAAVTEPAAGAVKGHKVDYSAHVEFVRSAKSLDEFIRGLTEYKSTVTAATTTLTAATTVPVLPTVSRSKNRGAIDAGFFLHFHKHKYESRWGLVLEPFHFETPLHREEILVNTSFDKITNNPINPAFILPLDRKRQFLGRLAFRIESSKSSIELGYQGGWEKNALTSLTSNAGNCDELATQPLNACLKNLQKIAGFNFRSIRQLNATRERNGPYVNLDWTIPVIWRFSLRTEDYGTYYRPAHLDNSTDTLYLNDAKETLKFTFPFLPNLALGPGLERIDYENKLEHVHLRTWGPVFSVTYNFDRYSGGNWKKSLGYSASASGAK